MYFNPRTARGLTYVPPGCARQHVQYLCVYVCVCVCVCAQKAPLGAQRAFLGGALNLCGLLRFSPFGRTTAESDNMTQ